jgi:hypothetical protein
MKERTGIVDFQFPYKVHIIHFIVEILVYFLILIPIILIALIRLVFPEIAENSLYSLAIPLSLSCCFILGIIFIYKRLFWNIPDSIYRQYILKNIKCPSCHNDITSYEKIYPRATQFSEFFYNCNFCKRKSLIEAPADPSKEWRQNWILSSITPDSKNYEKYKAIIESSSSDEEFYCQIDKEVEEHGLDPKDIQRSARQYHIKHGIYRDLEYDKKVRRITYLVFGIWLIIGILLQLFVFSKYNIEPFTDFRYNLALMSFFAVLTILFIAIFEHKNKKKKKK